MGLFEKSNKELKKTQRLSFDGKNFIIYSIASSMDGVVIYENSAEEALHHVDELIGHGYKLIAIGGSSFPTAYLTKPHVS
jgi:hypothetical protein